MLGFSRVKRLFMSLSMFCFLFEFLKWKRKRFSRFFSPFHQTLVKEISHQAKTLHYGFIWKWQQMAIPTDPAGEIGVRMLHLPGAPTAHPGSPQPPAQPPGRAARAPGHGTKNERLVPSMGLCRAVGLSLTPLLQLRAWKPDC